MSDASKFIRSILLKLLATVIAVTLVILISSSKLPDLFKGKINPCTQPITYSIGVFDSRFGLSQAQFESAIVEAKQIWEKPAGKQLFSDKNDGTGELKINLVYNGLQGQTQDLANLNKQISSNNKSYAQLKAEYDQMRSNYDNKKKAYDSALVTYNQKKQDYENQVSYWNAKGGAPESQYAQLQQQKNDLIQQQNSLNDMRQELGQIATNINQLSSQLNQLASNHNVSVRTYNSSGLVGKEFDEGLYIEDENGRRIEIYQFDNRAKLVRVLAHELGHALGFAHVDDPKAIMYRLNQGQNDALTQSDLAQLKAVCQ